MSTRAPRPSACPICGSPATAAATPFCGQGCRDRDLLRWLGDGYRLPGRAVPPDDQENPGDGLDSPPGAPL